MLRSGAADARCCECAPYKYQSAVLCCIVVSVCVRVQLIHGPTGSVVAVVTVLCVSLCVCECSRPMGPRMVLWWLLCVNVCAADPWAQDGSVVAVVCVQLTHGPMVSGVAVVCVCV